MPGELTPLEEVFLDHYLDNFNASKAMRAARPEGSPAGATALLRRPAVQQALRQRLAQLRERSDISAERTMVELGRCAFSDVRRLFTPDGALVPVHQLDDDIAAAISSIKVATRERTNEDGDKVVEHVIDYKLVDKGQALDRLMRHYGLFEADNEQALGSFADLLNERLRRVDGPKVIEGEAHSADDDAEDFI